MEETLKEIMTTLGGEYKVAKVLEIDPSVPYRWVKTGYVPPRYWLKTRQAWPNITVQRLYKLYEMNYIRKNNDLCFENSVQELQENN